MKTRSLRQALTLVAAIALVVGCGDSSGENSKVTSPPETPSPAATTPSTRESGELCDVVSAFVEDFSRVLVTEDEWLALADSMLALLPYAPEDVDEDLRTSADNARAVAELARKANSGEITGAEMEGQAQQLGGAEASSRVTRWMVDSCPEAAPQ